MKKMEVLEKKIRDAIALITDLRAENLKLKKEFINLKLNLRENDKDFVKFRKDSMEYESMKVRNEEIKKRLTLLLEKIENIEDFSIK